MRPQTFPVHKLSSPSQTISNSIKYPTPSPVKMPNLPSWISGRCRQVQHSDEENQIELIFDAEDFIHYPATHDDVVSSHSLNLPSASLGDGKDEDCNECCTCNIQVLNCRGLWRAVKNCVQAVCWTVGCVSGYVWGVIEDGCIRWSRPRYRLLTRSA